MDFDGRLRCEFTGLLGPVHFPLWLPHFPPGKGLSYFSMSATLVGIKRGTCFVFASKDKYIFDLERS